MQMLKDMFSVLLLIVITYSFNNQSSMGEFNSLIFFRENEYENVEKKPIRNYNDLVHLW